MFSIRWEAWKSKRMDESLLYLAKKPAESLLFHRRVLVTGIFYIIKGS